MDTPPYSDVSAQLSPGAHALHVNGDPHHAPVPGAVAHLHTANGATGAAGPSAAAGSVDARALYSTSWSALDSSPPPPTLREILMAYKQKGDGDRDMLLAMLNAKSAEDQRIASQLSLRRTMLEINKQTSEPHPQSQSQSHLPYSYTSHSHGQGQHVYTYVPDEQYALPGQHHHHQHQIAPASSPALPHAYSNSYSSAHSHAPRTHAHLRPVESPPLSSVTQKSVASLASRTRPAPRSHSRGGARPGDGRSQTHSVAGVQSQPLSQTQSQRRKRARRSRSRSPVPVASSSHRAYTYTRSPPPHSLSTSHSHTEAELEPDRSPYSSASASDSGSPRIHHARTMAIGSLLAGSKNRAGLDHGSDAEPNGPNADGGATAERIKEDRLERGQKLMYQTMREHMEDGLVNGYERDHRSSRGER